MRHGALLPKLKDLRQETITPESLVMETGEDFIAGTRPAVTGMGSSAFAPAGLSRTIPLQVAPTKL